MKSCHTPVMVDEMLDFFSDVDLKIFFDSTLGAGGHSEAIFKSHPEIVTLIGCDRDPMALATSSSRLDPWKDKLQLFHGNHIDLDYMCKSISVSNVDGFFLT